MGKVVTVGNAGMNAEAYLSEPAEPGPGVVLIHDWFGMLPPARQQCDSLAAAGFVALAPDLYDGKATANPAEAELMFDAMEIGRARTLLSTAARQLRSHPMVRPRRVGAVGFSMGGWLALLTATTGVFTAVVGYYTALEPGERMPLHCPVLLHLAEIDDWDPPDVPATFIAELRAGGTAAEARIWPGTRHGFANPISTLYAPEPAQAAWADTIAFLRLHLRT